MSKWQEFSEKFQVITPREQYLILFTGIVLIAYTLFTFFIDPTLVKNNEIKQRTVNSISEKNSIQSSITIYEEALADDPNEAMKKQIKTYEKKLKQVDDRLLLLTSELIEPIQMRYALLDLLKVQKGVSLVSFELLEVMPLMEKQETKSINKAAKDTTQNKTNVVAASSEPLPEMNLYRHGIRIKLTGKYFQLRDYLTQLEAMSWKFFWQEFQYTIKEYPLGEVEIEMYSLSTNKEFIGV
jgi:MSHA biogenesis protein MshJ